MARGLWTREAAQTQQASAIVAPLVGAPRDRLVQAASWMIHARARRDEVADA